MVHHDSTTTTSPTKASEKEQKMLQIRGDLQGLLLQQNWSAVDGMLRGIRYADPELFVSLITWKNQWQQSEPTLLHDMLTMPESDPPTFLLEMVLNAAPQVLFMEDANGNLPLQTAIYASPERQRSLKIIHFLVKRDVKRKTLSPVTFWQAIRRGNDEPVIRYLLQFPACAKALTIPVNGRVPLYYISKSTATQELTPLLRLLLEATCDESNKKWCCLYACIHSCSEYMYDAATALEIAKHEKLYCTNHLVEVAKQTNNTKSVCSASQEEEPPPVTTTPAMAFRAKQRADGRNSSLEAETSTNENTSFKGEAATVGLSQQEESKVSTTNEKDKSAKQDDTTTNGETTKVTTKMSGVVDKQSKSMKQVDDEKVTELPALTTAEPARMTAELEASQIAETEISTENDASTKRDKERDVVIEESNSKQQVDGDTTTTEASVTATGETAAQVEPEEETTSKKEATTTKREEERDITLSSPPGVVEE